jgi:hypothetical protein
MYEEEVHFTDYICRSSRERLPELEIATRISQITLLVGKRGCCTVTSSKSVLEPFCIERQDLSETTV